MQPFLPFVTSLSLLQTFFQKLGLLACACYDWAMTQNIDTQEIAKFSELAAHWWDPQGELKTLHQLNPLRLSYIQEKVALRGKKIIDIGCGGGILAESMALQGGLVTGIDMSEKALKAGQTPSP